MPSSTTRRLELPAARREHAAASRLLASDSAQAGTERYLSFVSIANSLTTNSAFADTFSRHGWWGLLYVCLTLGVAGFLFGHFLRYECTLSAAAGVLAYAVAEFWRIFLFAQGIVVYLLLVVWLAARIAARRYRG